MHEASCALYIRHKYNQADVDNFLGDEFVGAERKLPLKDMMATSVKEVKKLSAQAKCAVKIAGGPFSGKSRKRGGRGGWKELAAKGNFPPGFEKTKPAAGEQLGSKAQVQCFKCLEKGHFARD